MKKIEEAIWEHFKAVRQNGFQEEDILGIFLYGSQNYGTDTETSDVDTKAIIVPSFKDLCLSPIVSKEIHLENGEHCEVKDIREFVKMLRKQNINFVEVLYTNHYWINPRYRDIWESFFIDKREVISHYDVNKCVQSICGQAIHTLKQNKTDGKKYSNGLRLLQFLIDYIEGKPYAECLYSPVELLRQVLKDIKEGKTAFTEEDVDNLIADFEKIKSMNYPNKHRKDFIDDLILNKGIMTLIQRNLIDF